MRINQVLWVIHGETKTVIPVKIIEKITKETSAGEIVEFVFETTSGKRRNLSDLKDRYFETPEEARSFLVETATHLIDEIVNRAIDTSKKLSDFEQQDSGQPVLLPEKRDTIDLRSEGTMELPNGQVARVRIRA
jgi:hypothetical protein